MGKLDKEVIVTEENSRSLDVSKEFGEFFQITSAMMHAISAGVGREMVLQNQCAVNKMFIIWRKQEKFHSFVLTEISLPKDGEVNLILPEFASPLYVFLPSGFL